MRAAAGGPGAEGSKGSEGSKGLEGKGFRVERFLRWMGLRPKGS